VGGEVLGENSTIETKFMQVVAEGLKKWGETLSRGGRRTLSLGKMNGHIDEQS